MKATQLGVEGAGAEGDLGLARVGGDLALVVGIENGLWAGKGEHGMVAVREVLRAWHRC